MSDTLLRREFAKNTSWDTRARSQRMETPVPVRKGILFPELEIVLEVMELNRFPTGSGSETYRVSRNEILKTSHSAHEVSHLPAVVEEKAVSNFRWDAYDYIVAVGAILVLMGLLIPLLTKDKELTFIFPLGAACIGLGTFLSRRHTASV